ncbi:MAG: CRISPR-associated helicase Cas3' [Candidatus Delongbacteria bacterium]|jgi:CRISPR-associated endonuclease/helicase Cas3|nr:CRISPR-associated helicase Cas3' [Candidatus Delongbacteria bacterium]
MINLNKLAKPYKTIREHTDDLLNSSRILENLGYIDDETYKLLDICCEYHDYGKINDEFQKRVKSKVKTNFDSTTEVAHNVLSLLFINVDMFCSRDDYLFACYSIMNHHHHTNNLIEYDSKKILIEEFKKKFGGQLPSSRIFNKFEELKVNKKAQSIKGLLHKCDYAASGEYVIEYPADFLEDSLNDFLENNLMNRGYEWNDLQEYCIENKNDNLIVVANTGMGKTEAGLLWIGDNKGFFILPLRTAINAIYDRVKKDIVKENIKERVSLLHSDTLSHYLKEAESEEDKVLEYSKKGKQLSIPLTISTLDQLFNFVYKYHGFELKLATLSYSKIVIDEIQAYSPDLLAYLITGLEKITELGGKFAILTATLPPFIKDYIEENIGKIKSAKFTKGIDRHNVKVIKTEIDAEIINNHYKVNGGKILIVCNTVKKAQEIYASLKKENSASQINLLHAKFIKRDRAKKEEQIIKFGNTEIKDSGIWVATSIVEASLDIDFDYLFTELNDLNGFFQRLGRVNRKGEKVDMLNKANAFIFTEINSNLLKSKDSSRGFIDERIHYLSKDALENIEGLLPEEEKVNLIDKYLTTENIIDSSFTKRYNDVKKYIEDIYVGEKSINEVQKMFRDILSFSVIPKSEYEKAENKEIIDYNCEIIKEVFYWVESLSSNENKRNKDKLKVRKAKAREEILSFTVSVGIYDLNKTGNNVDIGFEKIDIINCDYSYEKGFIRIKKEKQVEVFDNFI